MATGDLERPCASWVSKEKGAGPAWSALEHRHKASRKREPTPTRLCAVSTRDRCRHTVPWKVAWFLWAAHALAACCNRYVRHAIPWLCWLKTTSRNLPFRRQHRMICRVASMGEGSPVLCAPHVDGGRPSPVCHEPPCDGSVASPLPLLAQEVLQLVHELLRVHVLLTLWGRRLGTRRVIGLL
jgi:hypothetical protein